MRRFLWATLYFTMSFLPFRSSSESSAISDLIKFADPERFREMFGVTVEQAQPLIDAKVQWEQVNWVAGLLEKKHIPMHGPCMSLLAQNKLYKIFQ